MARMFVDSGSFINILFKETFQMQLNPVELRPLSTSLFSFAGHEVKPLEQVNLSLSLGEEPLRRTCTTIFMVVEATSAYNVILGRLAMSSFKAVASIYHHKIKFPIGGGVGKVQENQTTSRKCYIKMVWVDMKRVRVGGDALEYQR